MIRQRKHRNGVSANTKHTDKTRKILTGIEDEKKLIQLSHKIIVEATPHQRERMGDQAHEDCYPTTKYKREGPTVSFKEMVRITSKTKDPTTVLVITKKGTIYRAR